MPPRVSAVARPGEGHEPGLRFWVINSSVCHLSSRHFDGSKDSLEIAPAPLTRSSACECAIGMATCAHIYLTDTHRIRIDVAVGLAAYAHIAYPGERT